MTLFDDYEISDDGLITFYEPKNLGYILDLYLTKKIESYCVMERYNGWRYYGPQNYLQDAIFIKQYIENAVHRLDDKLDNKENCVLIDRLCDDYSEYSCKIVSHIRKGYWGPSRGLSETILTFPITSNDLENLYFVSWSIFGDLKCIRDLLYGHRRMRALDYKLKKKLQSNDKTHLMKSYSNALQRINGRSSGSKCKCGYCWWDCADCNRKDNRKAKKRSANEQIINETIIF